MTGFNKIKTTGVISHLRQFKVNPITTQDKGTNL